MTFGVNDSPLASRDGTHLTGGRIGDRLLAEAETNLAINVIPGLSIVDKSGSSSELSDTEKKVSLL
ncbi:hypothetical protein AALP_AAs59096U000100, partial [Arabis alpina]